MRNVLAACLLLTACGGEQAGPAAGVPLFIVSIDTLRADRLPVYGYAAGSTPNIDAFRRDAILYQWAFSNCPQTLPAHASLFTGTLPPVHGVRDNIGYHLGTELPTLATLLRRRGYATGAAVSSYVLRRATGIAEGFELYDDRVGGLGSRPTSAERDGEETRIALTSWIEQAADRRLFGFLHLYEPHAPYAAPRGFRRVKDEYDNEVAYADDVLGRFFATLRQRDLYDGALIVVLSDHGEGLGDHGEDEHVLFVYRESIHVPLLVKLPGRERAGETVRRPVSLHEVAGLVLSVTGAETEESALLDRNATPVPVYSESYYPRLHFGWSELRSIVSGDRHFIDAPARELYDYIRDPEELRNLADGERRVVHALTAMAREIDSAFKDPVAVDPEDRRRLAALGYIGSAAAQAGKAADPKDKVQIVRDLRRAYLFSAAGRHRDAIPLLERVVFYEPAIVDGWAMLGRSRSATGQRALALEAYYEGLRRFPGNTDLALLAADEYANAGNWEAAVQHAELAIPNDPVLANEALARFAARRGDDAAAKRYAESAIRHAPGRLPTLILLADLARRASRPAEQLMWLDRAEQEIAARAVPAVEGVAFQRGEALLALGRVAEAEAAFRAEVGGFPQNVDAWSSLAVVVGAQGRRDEVRAILDQALRINDTPRMRALAREALEVTGAGGTGTAR
ncbi:MAG TPA: sulfatase-like hydrolase/transferase [Thermoanaerobaculia bacterium]|nr:sulfatase-like hydrolase/transferase [Thermoanaerobaculia bacterium]